MACLQQTFVYMLKKRNSLFSTVIIEKSHFENEWYKYRKGNNTIQLPWFNTKQ